MTSPKVISLVPSLTETLIECGVHVVGRTRFCIHPKDRVKSIPVLGGTKDVDWEKAKDLKPDLVLFDKEENTLEMAQSCPYPSYSTHVLSLKDSANEFIHLAELLAQPALKSIGERIQNIVESEAIVASPEALPGWKESDTVLYMIWRNPWMAVSQNTYIGSVLAKIGIHLPTFGTRYATIDLFDHDPSTTYILFSSEPFPFHKQKQFIQSLGYRHAYVNGESFSWFGWRSLLYLESLIKND